MKDIGVETSMVQGQNALLGCHCRSRGKEKKMPSKIVLYECKYCGEKFPNWDECEEHEHTHLCNYSNKDTKVVIELLRQLSENAYDYRIGDLVFGMPISNFESLMNEAAKRLEEGKSDGNN